MALSKIEWTESTWNPVTGCTKISAGCRNCYAERLSKRLMAMGQPNYQHDFSTVVCHEHALSIPFTWKKPQHVFVNSMGDLFHEDVPISFIKKVFEVMNSIPRHRFQLLTKRAKRLADVCKILNWTENIWMGVTVEDQDAVSRIENLIKTAAAVKFLSIEPLIGKIQDIDLKGIDWVIVGGESGPGAREMDEEWVLDIKNKCEFESVPFFFKQWGGTNKKKAGRTFLGRTWDEMPRK